EGRSAETIAAARELGELVKPEMAREMPEAEAALVTPLLALARFGRWQEILDAPAPPDDLAFAQTVSHYARGLALTRTGRLDDADLEQTALEASAAKIPPDRMTQQVNSLKSLADIASAVLAGERASARAHNVEAVRHLEEAVRRQDALRYMEPPPWYYPVRQSLGAALLAAGRARAAEAVYREDLRRNRDNGWSLYGLARSLRAQKKVKEAAAVEARFKRAWAAA